MKKSVSTIEEVKEKFTKINKESDSYIEFIKSQNEYRTELVGARFNIVSGKDINDLDVFLLYNNNTQEIIFPPYKDIEQAKSCIEELEKESL